MLVFTFEVPHLAYTMLDTDLCNLVKYDDRAMAYSAWQQMQLMYLYLAAKTSASFASAISPNKSASMTGMTWSR